ncbi:MAG: glycosyltransferase [Methanoregula sp.]|uniref:glycosyltransferase family 2 protein n=1 Tax=Methanoregula sp. TaxID=2052170 RepID=UPI0025FC9937|nr:glycosyltransferase [Methanoregula sp.]MCK9630267.1 glycosyltransferase [Methanoregula sp.]
MPDTPLVSICIPTYNRAGMIGRAIESALAQSYRNIEVIVVDNNSNDNTATVVASHSDKRLRYVKNERNLGLFGNCNRCIELATGTYLHILHSDDFIDPGFTSRCVAFFQEHPSVVLTTTSARIVTETEDKEMSYNDTDRVYSAPDGFRSLLSARSFIVCPSVMVRRDIYKEVGSFSLEYPYSSDYYQWLKIARRYDIGFVSGACLFYHQGQHSETFRFMFSSPQGYMDMLRMFVQIKMDLGNESDQYTGELLAAQRRFINDCLFAGFTRGDAMPGFSPSIFTGFSLTCWTMEKTDSISQMFGKLRDLLIILPAGLLISWSLPRKMVRALFFSRRDSY